MIQTHVDKTGSPKGKEILNNWDNYVHKFWQVVPPSEANSPEVVAEAKSLTSV